MKKSLIINLILLLALSTSLELTAFVKKSSTNKTQVTSVFELENKDLTLLSRSELEERIGKKLSIKEKIVLRLVRKKIKKQPELNGLEAAEQVKTSGFAIAGFVCGLVGLFVAGIPLGILGTIFSAVALSKIKNNSETMKGKGLAIAGLVLSIASIIGALIFVLMMA